MEEKDLVTIFDEYFGEEVNNNIFINAQAELKKIQTVKELKFGNRHLRAFVRYFHLMKKNNQTAIDYLRATIKSAGCLSIIKKVAYGLELNNVKKINSNVEKFEFEFMNRTGIDLVDMEDYMFNREKEHETNI